MTLKTTNNRRVGKTGHKVRSVGFTDPTGYRYTFPHWSVGTKGNTVKALPVNAYQNYSLFIIHYSLYRQENS